MERFLYKRPQKDNAKLNMFLAYPAPETFAMSSLGYLSIFKELDLNPDIDCKRIYQDTLNTPYPPKNADCIGFSFSFEFDIFNVIKILNKYEIPLKSALRDENDPFIFAGGPVLMANPLPFEDFFDFISVGEKCCLNDALKIIEKKDTLNKDEILKELSELEGIYVPKYKKEKIKISRDNLEKEVVYTPILSDKSYFKDTFIIELSRGCPKMCNFCIASWLNLPVRFAPFDKIIEAIDIGLQYTNKIALLGAYVAGHPKFGDIIDYISKKSETSDIELSISSLRADLADENLIKTLVKCHQHTATIALEAGSQRLRDLIKKDLKEEQLLNTIKVAQKNGLKGFKIYTMIGLPTETSQDIDELINLAKKIKAQIKADGGSFDITISTSTFIPKAHTPFERVERFDKKILEQRMNYLKKNLHKLGITMRPSSIEWDMVQSILSRYDSSLADFLIETANKGANLGAFKQVWRSYNKKGFLPDFESVAKNPSFNIKALKWDFVENGALRQKQARALEYGEALNKS